MQILVTRRTRPLAIFKPTEIRTNWTRQILTCECGCQFRLHPKDEPKIFAKLEEVDGGNLGMNDFLIYFIFCPEWCGQTVQIGPNVLPSRDDYKQASPITLNSSVG